MKQPYKILVSICQRMLRGVYYMIPIILKGFNATLMQNFLENGTEAMGNGPRMFYLDLDVPYFMLGDQSYGKVNCKRKFL